MVEDRKFEKVALVIGIDEYNHLSSLNYACSDACGIARVLQTNEAGFISVTTRVSNDSVEPITRSVVFQSLNDVASQVAECGTILFYFSGHGCLAFSKGNSTVHLAT